jgi:hypothetical protein
MPKRQSTLEGRARTAKARAVLAARLPPGPRRNARPRRPPGWPRFTRADGRPGQ